MKLRSVVAIMCLAVVWAGCSSTKQVPSSGDYYAQGDYYFSHMIYRGAIDNYQHLIDEYPFSPYADTAELKIGLAYYQLKSYPEAITSFSDFIRMHPTSKSLPLANYYLGMSYYKQIVNPDRDQSVTEDAITVFRNIETLYPESPFAQLAHDRIEVCRENLARNELIIGNYYGKRANFRAAESRLAELAEKYPDTPVAAQALYELGTVLEQEGKKYSAAQAFAAVERHFADTKYNKLAAQQLQKLNQPVETEEDPLELVLAETGFGSPEPQPPLIRETHHEDDQMDGHDGLTAPGPAPAAEPAAASGPVTLRGIRLAASAQPLSVIFDMSGPVKFEKHFENGPGYSTLTVRLLNAQPDAKLDHHIVFDRSIFKDSSVAPDAGGTTITVNTVPVARFAIIPLDDPARLLVTFTPQQGDQAQGS